MRMSNDDDVRRWTEIKEGEEIRKKTQWTK
jgi:hypothetical protein